MKLIRYFSKIALVAFLAIACAAPSETDNKQTTNLPQEQTTARPSPEDRIPRITAGELYKKYIDKADILIVDARHKEEYDAEHIPGAISAPLDDILSRRWTPPEDLNKEIVFYCT